MLSSHKCRRLDSNQRSSESESDALSSYATPTNHVNIAFYVFFVNETKVGKPMEFWEIGLPFWLPNGNKITFAIQSSFFDETNLIALYRHYLSFEL